MFSLKLSVVVCWLAMVGLEAKPAPAMPVGSYSFSSQLGSNSIDQQQPAETTRTTARGRVVAGGPTEFIVDTPEVQDAKEKFFDAFKQQTDLINEIRDEGLWSVQPYADYYEDFEEAGQSENEYDDEEGEGDEGEEDDEEDEEDDDDEEDSDEEDDSSSSSEEDSSSSEEDSDEEDSDEEDEDEEDEDDEEGDDDDDDDDDDDEEDSDESDSSSSSEEDYGDDSSSSSSSSSSEENGDPALLSMKALQALQPKQVENTPEVEAANKRFFDQYKAQLELVTNDIY